MSEDQADLKPTLPSDVVWETIHKEEETMKSFLGVALIATATLLGGAAITTGSSQPASAGVENSRATTMATDFSARRRYRRVVRYAPHYYRYGYVQQRYYAVPVYPSSVYSSYGSYRLHSGYHHTLHSAPHSGPHNQLHYAPYNCLETCDHY